jgi:hypothetical protein
MRVSRYGLVLAMSLLCGVQADSPRPSAQNNPGQQPFADFVYLPPPSQYTGRVFKLSQQYPAELPPKERIPEFFKIDFKTQWREYLLAARDYCYAGNVTPGGDVENDWRIADANPPRWFHMPWQTYGPLGREGVHGLTQEAPVQSRQLAWSQTYTGGTTFAVGMFNEFGGYGIGQIWKDHNNPDLSKGPFPEGTVICKVLFVDVPTDQVPCLVNPLQWKAYVPPTYVAAPPPLPRGFKMLALVQMDLMAKDSRAPNGWVFGNFQYNGATNHKNLWENLVPVGVLWGNDPGIAENQSNSQPVTTIRNPNLKETIINDDTKELPPTHLGWNGRLNGPVDNPMSSCMSCHMTAEYPVLNPMSPLFQDPAQVPAPGSAEWMRWFQNMKCGVPFDQGAQSTDFSLQLVDSIQNFRAWQDEEKSLYGLSASAYGAGGMAPPGAAAAAAQAPRPLSPFKVRINGREQFKILRDVPHP